jgi:hypothetical protein
VKFQWHILLRTEDDSVEAGLFLDEDERMPEVVTYRNNIFINTGTIDKQGRPVYSASGSKLPYEERCPTTFAEEAYPNE